VWLSSKRQLFCLFISRQAFLFQKKIYLKTFILFSSNRSNKFLKTGITFVIPGGENQSKQMTGCRPYHFYFPQIAQTSLAIIGKQK
jgi:hypothetical protein